jgi:hypothetical protein
VLEYVRVLFGLVTMRLSHAGDGATESMLVVACLGATADHQGAIDDRKGATVDRPGAVVDHPIAAGYRRGVAADCRVPSPAAKVSPPTTSDEDIYCMDTTTSSWSNCKTYFRYGNLVLVFFLQLS